MLQLVEWKEFESMTRFCFMLSYLVVFFSFDRSLIAQTHQCEHCRDTGQILIALLFADPPFPVTNIVVSSLKPVVVLVACRSTSAYWHDVCKLIIDFAWFERQVLDEHFNQMDDQDWIDECYNRTYQILFVYRLRKQDGKQMLAEKEASKQTVFAICFSCTQVSSADEMLSLTKSLASKISTII